MNFTVSSLFMDLFNSSLFLILQIPPSWTSPQILRSIFFSKILNKFSSDFVRVQVSDPYVTAGLISVLYIYILSDLFIISFYLSHARKKLYRKLCKIYCGLLSSSENVRLHILGIQEFCSVAKGVGCYKPKNCDHRWAWLLTL